MQPAGAGRAVDSHQWETLSTRTDVGATAGSNARCSPGQVLIPLDRHREDRELAELRQVEDGLLSTGSEPLGDSRLS